MKVLVTGSAGFIGSALSIRLLDRGDTVIGIDNHNDYYDPALKEARFTYAVPRYMNKATCENLISQMLVEWSRDSFLAVH